RRSGVGIEEFLPGCRLQLDGLLEALDPKLPKDIAVAGVDAEQRWGGVGMLHERTRDTVVMLHNKTENLVGVTKVVKGGLEITAIPIPDDWKPLTGLDQVGADQQASDEAGWPLTERRRLAE